MAQPAAALNWLPPLALGLWGAVLLQALASDLKLRLEVFDPLELVPADAQRTPELYLQVMRQNGEAVAATFQP